MAHVIYSLCAPTAFFCAWLLLQAYRERGITLLLWSGLFFAIQAGGALVEHSPSGKRLGLGQGLAGWAFTMLLVLAPLPLLFHRPFVEQVVLPMLRDLQGLLS